MYTISKYASIKASSFPPTPPPNPGNPRALELLISSFKFPLLLPINNGNRTKWSPIRSVIIRVINKSDDREAGIRFVNHEYDYRENWTTRIPVTNIS